MSDLSKDPEMILQCQVQQILVDQTFIEEEQEFFERVIDHQEKGSDLSFFEAILMRPERAIEVTLGETQVFFKNNKTGKMWVVSSKIYHDAVNNIKKTLKTEIANIEKNMKK
jgi:hypothetical protein